MWKVSYQVGQPLPGGLRGRVDFYSCKGFSPLRTAYEKNVFLTRLVCPIKQFGLSRTKKSNTLTCHDDRVSSRRRHSGSVPLDPGKEKFQTIFVFQNNLL